MRHTYEANRPRVFLSFAGNDRAVALRLCRDLSVRGINAFVDEQNIAPGDNFVLAINQALTQSDYYVLLWSRASVDRPWVDAEWSAAFTRELRERRSFLFIVRLDMTPLPPLLAPRQYLDAFDNSWDELVNELAATWSRDRAVGELVLPTPFLTATGNGEFQRSTVVIYVRNRALSVAHVIAVPGDSTGRDLEILVRNTLALPDIEKKFGGAVGMRFYYELKNAGKRILPDSRKLVELHIEDGDTVDLEVQVESFGPAGTSHAITYREGASTSLPPATTRYLINSAFGHLIPW